MGQRAGLTHRPHPSPPGPTGAGSAPPAWPHRCRIRSLPLNSVFPVIISAMMQPTDQMSTETEALESGLCGPSGGDSQGGQGPWTHGSSSLPHPHLAPPHLSSLPEAPPWASHKETGRGGSSVGPGWPRWRPDWAVSHLSVCSASNSR